MFFINRVFYFLMMLSVCTQSSFSMEEERNQKPKPPFKPSVMLPNNMEYIIDENGNRKLTKKVMPREKMDKISRAVDEYLIGKHGHEGSSAQDVHSSPKTAVTTGKKKSSFRF